MLERKWILIVQTSIGCSGICILLLAQIIMVLNGYFDTLTFASNYIFYMACICLILDFKHELLNSLVLMMMLSLGILAVVSIFDMLFFPRDLAFGLSIIIHAVPTITGIYIFYNKSIGVIKQRIYLPAIILILFLFWVDYKIFDRVVLLSNFFMMMNIPGSIFTRLFVLLSVFSSLIFIRIKNQRSNIKYFEIKKVKT